MKKVKNIFIFCRQLVPENGAIKFFQSIDLDKVYKKDGKIEGFYDVPVAITGSYQLLHENCQFRSHGFPFQ